MLRLADGLIFVRSQLTYGQEDQSEGPINAKPNSTTYFFYNNGPHS
jgi:hypothetical protein